MAKKALQTVEMGFNNGLEPWQFWNGNIWAQPINRLNQLTTNQDKGLWWLSQPTVHIGKKHRHFGSFCFWQEVSIPGFFTVVCGNSNQGNDPFKELNLFLLTHIWGLCCLLLLFHGSNHWRKTAQQQVLRVRPVVNHLPKPSHYGTLLVVFDAFFSDEMNNFIWEMKDDLWIFKKWHVQKMTRWLYKDG